MSFEDLPDIPGSWLDFIRSRLPLRPALTSISALLDRARALTEKPIDRHNLCNTLANAGDLCSGRTLDSIQKLRHPESVVVSADIYPGLFGGQTCQILKCLTAIKICEELESRGFRAIPLCWINVSSAGDFAKPSIQLLDSESELHCLELEFSEAGNDFSPLDLLPSNQIGGLLRRIEELGKGIHDPEILQFLKEAYSAETTFAHASARLMASLLKDWGMIVINPQAAEFQSFLDKSARTLPSSLVQSAVLPILARVIDPYEVDSYVREQRNFEAVGRMQPMAWPQAGATVIDSRNRRTLERYNLDLSQLFSGQKAIIERFADAIPHQASQKLLNLRQEVEGSIARLRTYSSAENNFEKAAVSARGKILFQLDRLRENFDAACQRKQETFARHIRRACNALAPNGRIQERELAGIYLPLRYSRAILRSVYEKLSILSLEHQLIYLD